MTLVEPRPVADVLPGLGAARRVAANERLLLDDPSRAWIVTHGDVRVFAIEKVEGEPVGVAHPLFTCGAGSLLIGTDREDLPFVLVVVGTTAQASARPISLLALRHLVTSSASHTIADRVEIWTRSLASAVRDISQQILDERRRLVYVAPGEVAQVPPDAAIMPRGREVWIRSPQPLTLWGWPAAGDIPLPPYAWAEVPDGGTVETTTAEAALATNAGWEGLWSFLGDVLELLGERVSEARQAEVARQRRLDAFEDEMGQAVFTDLGNVVAGTDDLSLVRSAEGHDLLGAVGLVAAAMGIDVVDPPASVLEAADSPLEVVARTSGFRTRKVTLTKNWWRQEAGPLLGQIEEDSTWVALLPEGRRRYVALVAATGERLPVTAALSRRFAFEAFQLYRPLPPGPLSGRDLLGYVWADVRGDGRRIALSALAIGLLSIVPTLAAQFLFTTVIPQGDRPQLAWIVSLMLAGAVAAGAFSLYQGVVSLRLETKASLGVQAAIFSRLLDLPAAFFRRFASADLAVRSMGIETLRETLSQYTVATVLAGAAAACNLVVMFVIEPPLALFGLLAVGLALWVMRLGFRVLAARHYEVQEAQGRLYATGVQLLGAVLKLRVAHAERRAFSRWALQFAAMKRCEVRASRARGVLTTFFVAFLPLATALVMVGAAVMGTGTVSSGSFLAFNTAFTQVVAALVALSATTYLLANASPLLDRMRPILDVTTESSAAKPDPGPLRGAVDVSAVSFRYRPDGPLVLDDVSFSIEPGQMVAIVGPSGSGKSSLLRLLLGFDHPETGMVSYDGQDLRSVDVRAVRRQCGVVIQGTRLMPGEIRYNIVGTRRMTLSDAWRAAEVAGIDSYIRSLPMGMDTVVSEQGGAFSGGQRQLLLIARAVAGRPKIILLDEATSALDNASQATVMHNVEAMNATRIVIAHRLSTIRKADKILVLVGGRLVQHGTFAELSEHPGPFMELVSRQTL